MVFVFDENYPMHLSEGIAKLEQGNLRTPNRADIKHVITVLERKGATDEEIIAALGKISGVLITQDKDFKDKKHYFSLYREHKVGVVIYKIPKKDIYWDKVISFVKNWEELKELINKTSRPFAFMIDKKGGVQTCPF